MLNPAAGADISSRSEAEIGLATVLEKRGLAIGPGAERDELLKQSLGHLLRIFHAGNLNPGETASCSGSTGPETKPLVWPKSWVSGNRRPGSTRCCQNVPRRRRLQQRAAQLRTPR